MKNALRIALGFVAGAALTALAFYLFILPQMQLPTHLAPFQTTIVKATADNTDFRHVLFTGAKSQLVVMSIPPGGEVGDEIHPYVEQILYFQSGTGEALMDGKTSPIGPGDVVVVTPGTRHNFTNTGTVPMQITTTYAPPNHIDDRIQHTIADAKADTADEAFGQAVR
jgi:mannose-6-phosphate isomerase-like protein (cupin superfamily)